MSTIQTISSVYFVGAGGIGMSALVRYFLSKGKKVAGYDRTPTDLTSELNREGAEIHYEDNVALIPDYCRNPQNTLVVYTPAWLRGNEAGTGFGRNYELFARSLCGRDSWEDDDFFHAGAYLEAIACGLQCVSWWYLEKLREQSHAF